MKLESGTYNVLTDDRYHMIGRSISEDRSLLPKNLAVNVAGSMQPDLVSHLLKSLTAEY